MLFNEPKLLKCHRDRCAVAGKERVSVLFNEPKLLKYAPTCGITKRIQSFSALQRAEIAEILRSGFLCQLSFESFSALQRAEIAEIGGVDGQYISMNSFSALQRAEIAEIKDRLPELVARLGFQCSSTSRNC